MTIDCTADNGVDTCTVVSGTTTISYDSNAYDFSDISIAVTSMIQDLMNSGKYADPAVGIVAVSYRSIQLIGGPSSSSNHKSKNPPVQSPVNSSSSQFASVNTATGAYIIVVCCGIIVASGMLILYFNRSIPSNLTAFIEFKDEHLYDPKLYFVKEHIPESLEKQEKKQVPAYESFPTPENQAKISARSIRKMMAKNKSNLSTIEETSEEGSDDIDDCTGTWDSSKIPYFKDSPQNRPLNEILEDDCYLHMISPGSQTYIEDTDEDSMPSI